jgi:hypothetical protein
VKDLISSIVHAFSGGANFEKASASLDVAAQKYASKHRVTIKVPRSPAGKYVVYSRVAADAALLDIHDAHPTDFDAFDIADAGEVLNLLVDHGYHRIHAAPLPTSTKRRWLGTEGMLLAIPQDPEAGVLLFSGDVHSDVGLA